MLTTDNMQHIRTQMESTISKVKSILGSSLPSNNAPKPKRLKNSEIVSRFYKMTDADLNGIKQRYGEEVFKQYIDSVKALEAQGY
jgi:hypothetical protein